MKTRISSLPRTARSSVPVSCTLACLDCNRASKELRLISSLPSCRIQSGAELPNTNTSYSRLGRSAREKLIDRDFFLSLLNSASTKREAKSYLARLKIKPEEGNKAQKAAAIHATTESQSLSSGVNLGAFYGASRFVYDSPVFRQDAAVVASAPEPQERLHLALVKITAPERLDSSVINGVAKTLSQLSRLGMACCVVVDTGLGDGAKVFRETVVQQAERISKAVDAQPDSKSVYLDSVLTLAAESSGLPSVSHRNVLLSLLRRGQTVIIMPVACAEDTVKATPVSGNDVLLALTKEFAGCATVHCPDADPMATVQVANTVQNEVSLDRVIILDPLGGIPAFSGPHTSHVFINIEQEYEDIENELLQMQQLPASEIKSQSDFTASPSTQSMSSTADSSPLPKPVSPNDISVSHESARPSKPLKSSIAHINGHLDNLRLTQRALSLLPSTSSGIITSPTEVANSATAHTAADISVVGTRRQRNPLIHNLLTDKPLLSSSLPVRRRGAANAAQSRISVSTSHTTLVKRGMPLMMLPNPRLQTWTAKDRLGFTFDHPDIDTPRLVHLIEDSFNRKLDVQNYLNRVNGHLAGLIIAGEYEGGAILTWELPPGVKDDGSAESESRMVPYLDKFAVLKRSQGAGGVADIVFNAMVRACFPNGVCWRSRKDNPVNKWYFERSRGTFKLADSNWSMFWTTPSLLEDRQKFHDYEAVCRSIQPSWADDKSIAE